MSLENLTPEEVAKLRSLLGEEKEKTSEETTTPSEPEKALKNQKASKGPRKPWYRNRVILSATALVAVVALAFLYVFAVEPWLSLRSAQNELTQETAKSSITVGNSAIVSYTATETDEVLSGANPKQLALGKDGEATPASYIEFRSDKAGNDSHVLDLYIDFYSQRSRDLISLNNVTLANYISSGKIILRVHPVLDKDGFSVFAPEALAEVAGTNPKLAWDFFVSLMKNSDSVLSNPNTETAATPSSKEIVDFIAGIAKTTGVPTGSPDGVDADSIKYLSFFSWLYSGGKDEKLAVGYYPPVLYIDGKEINQDDWILTDPNSLLKLITSLS